ncbi:MAG: hypothetical protein GY841_02500 [FCB group bacterium]|nr:hypothetical protein [FCB group bacterium]
MLKSGLIVGLVLLLGGAVMAQVDSSPTVEIRPRFSLGGTYPYGPQHFDNKWNYGLCGLAGIGFKNSPSTEWVAKAEFMRFVHQDGSFDSNRELFLLGLDLILRNDTPASSHVYIVAGLGRASVNSESGDWYNSTAKDRETTLYIDLGFGAEFATWEKTSIFIQGRLVMLFTAGEDLVVIPLQIGLVF